MAGHDRWPMFPGRIGPNLSTGWMRGVNSSDDVHVESGGITFSRGCNESEALACRMALRSADRPAQGR